MNQDYGIEVQVSSFDWQVRGNDKTNLTNFWENIKVRKKLRKIVQEAWKGLNFRALIGGDLVCSWCIFGVSTKIQVSLQVLMKDL